MKRSHSPVALSSRTTILLAISLVVVSGLAKQSFILPIERAVVDLFYAVPVRFDIIVINITHFGSLAALYSAVAVTFVIGYKRLAASLFASGMLAYIGAALLKEVIMRPRPPQLWPDLVAREWGPISYGYPSGHTALVAAVAFTLWPYVKTQYRIFLIIFVILVGASRMILAMHSPLDLIGGTLIGILAAYTGSSAFGKFKK